MFNENVFKIITIKPIPMAIWILLKFKKTVVNKDSFKTKDKEYTTIVYAKYLFGKIYVMKTEYYVNNKLVSCSDLKRVQRGVKGYSAHVWLDDLDLF